MEISGRVLPWNPCPTPPCAAPPAAPLRAVCGTRLLCGGAALPWRARIICLLDFCEQLVAAQGGGHAGGTVGPRTVCGATSPANWRPRAATPRATGRTEGPFFAQELRFFGLRGPLRPGAAALRALLPPPSSVAPWEWAPESPLGALAMEPFGARLCNFREPS